MKKFKFRLEKVLQYRNVVREEKRKELARVNMRLHEEQDRLQDLLQAELTNSLPEQEVVDCGRYIMSGLYGIRLLEEIALQRETIAESEKEVAAALAEYVEASKEAEALETLKKRKLAEYREYVTKEEDKFLDELVTQRFARRSEEKR